MSYLEQFKHDVFISYAHDNNMRGWVKDLRDVLEERLVSELGGPPRPSVWFDEEQVTGIEEIKQTIPTAAQNCAALLCVLSPSYLKSAWCLKEREAFLEQLKSRPETNTKFKVPLVKVVVADLERADEPESMRGLVGYKYIDKQPKVRDWTRQFYLTGKDHLDQRFFNQTDKMARELAELLKALKRTGTAASEAAVADKTGSHVTTSGPIGQAVYIAEGTDDVDDDRDLLAKELGQFNVRALPAETLPTDFDSLKSGVVDMLKKCEFSVHIIGRYYGTRLKSDPSPVKRSAAHIQYDFAVEGGKPRIVWLPSAIDEEQLPAEQKGFLAAIRDHRGPAAGPEFTRGDLQQLKALIRSRLPQDGDPPPPPDGPVVFVSAHANDLNRREVKQIVERARICGCDGFHSAHDNDPKKGEEREDAFIRRADGVVILYASPLPAWVQDRAWKVREVLGRRRRNPLMATVVDSEPPPTDRPAIPFAMQSIAIVDARNGFDPAMLDPFFNRLRQLRRAR